jgi:protein gp37
MKKTKIDWADSTWNPVTGCLHGCEYCYARKIANRFDGKADRTLYFQLKDKPDVFDLYEVLTDAKGCKTPYPFGFEPTFHRYRLNEPAQMKKAQNIFVCSMADLFGEWVPDKWIREVLKACEATPQHRYLFLTKNPKRYERVLDRYFPPNMWFGWSQDGPMGKAMSHTTHHSIQSFVSLEPLRRPFETFNVMGLDWAIVGAETGNHKNKAIPQKSWVDAIAEECAKHSVPLFMKESLRGLMGDNFIQEYPWEARG